MARPARNNIDYFPFYCEDGKKMFYLEETYGNDGFAVFVKLLRELAKTDFHYLNLSNKTTLMFLSAKCKVTKEILESIINDLVDLGKFDALLWNENKIIWCQDFIDSIQDAYSKRNNKCITYEGLGALLVSLGVRKPTKRNSKGGENPQSIVEYSIVKESIEDIYKLYPSKCPIQKRLTGKTAKNKSKIEDLLKTNSAQDLKDIINLYIADSIKTNTYIKNFGTFLNNLPEKEPQKKTVEKGFVTYERMGMLPRTCSIEDWPQIKKELGPQVTAFNKFINEVQI